MVMRRRQGQVVFGAVMVALVAAVLWFWWLNGNTEAEGPVVALFPTDEMLAASEPITEVVTNRGAPVFDDPFVTSTWRWWVLSAPGQSDAPAPGELSPPTVWFVTHTDVEGALDTAILHDHAADITPIEVRGTTGTVSSRPPGYYAVLVWEEAPGVIARLRYGPSDDPVADAVEVANALIAADDREWRAFSDAHGGEEYEFEHQ